MRINKFLAENGVASRRRADDMIAAGRVKINGRTATLGEDVQDGDAVLVDGNLLVPTEKSRNIIS